MFAIFGHGNVTCLGHALQQAGDALPTWRGQNEGGMALAAIGYAKAARRRQVMVATSSIGPGALNMVTAAGAAMANRLPLLLLVGDTHTSRVPDPVLQQVEHPGAPSVTANDAFRAVSRYWDRITRPEQLVQSLPQALRVLLDPAECGPAVLALPQDTQAEAWDFPREFFRRTVHVPARPRPDLGELDRAAVRPALGAAAAAGGRRGCPLLDGRSRALPLRGTSPGAGGGDGGGQGQPGRHRPGLGRAHRGDGLGRRQPPGGGGRRRPGRRHPVGGLRHRLVDRVRGRQRPLRLPQRRPLRRRQARRPSPGGRCPGRARGAQRPPGRLARPRRLGRPGRRLAEEAKAMVAKTTAPGPGVPTYAQVVGAVNRAATSEDYVLTSSGGLPGELNVNWLAKAPGSFDCEYGFSCMGYEISGAWGAAMARTAFGSHRHQLALPQLVLAARSSPWSATAPT